jgi:hypothetical protein
MKQIIAKQYLKDIQIEINKTGFTIWIYDPQSKCRHWIVDGSVVKTEGVIYLGDIVKEQAFQARYNKRSNTIRLVNKNFKEENYENL